ANPLGRKYVFSQRANPLKQNFFAKPKAGFSSPASSSRKSKLFLILLLEGGSSRKKGFLSESSEYEQDFNLLLGGESYPTIFLFCGIMSLWQRRLKT
ncbi:hypothetical protein IJF86_02905, partial [Candidatus Saccharibacteria bacterium]|nr:hypothetical protein [Candidatus Saccharibacteria bacterium]